MKQELKFIFITFVLGGIILWVGVFLFQEKRNDNRQEFLNKLDVQFSGAIISKKEITRFGRSTIITCVDLSYTNTESYFLLAENHYIYCKIENNIASIVIPADYERIDSIAINMNNNHLEQFYLKGKLIAEFPLSLSYAYLKKEDLDFCFK